MALKEGTVVEFSFDVVGQRKTGIGAIADGGLTNYSCWPPGYTVKVISSPDYKKGQHIAVCGGSIKRLVKR